ncbi:regulator [Pseudolysinimonas sp.]|uniref:AAA family ATPase n=1 Tax=Pseudolysinimonas sp. TaxID=2680009 RepID=UPI00286BB00A|nr:regulator [Pseudolysinimonas sp.]
MTDVGLAIPIADADRLAAEAVRYGHRVVAQVADADALAPQIAAVKPEVVIAAAATPYLSTRLVAACDAHGVRLVVVGDSSRERRFAAGLGVVDPVPGPPAWTLLTPGSGIPVAVSQPIDVPSEVSAAQMTDRPVRRAVDRGSVIAVWGPGGAPGRTSLAIALAAELAATGASVALADADTHGAAVAPSLGLLDEAPGFAAACRLAGTGSLTPAELDRVASTHRGSFRVLTGIGRPARWPELTGERVAGVLDAVRGWAGITVVDVAASLEQDEELVSDVAAPRRNAATVETLRRADRVVAVGAADPIGLARFLRGHADLLDHVTPDRVTVVINKVRAGVVGLDPAAQVRSTLERFGSVTPAHLVPWDPAGFDAALLSGRSLAEAAPRSPARAVIRKLAADLARR